MKAICGAAVLLLGWWTAVAFADEALVLAKDGSISGPLVCAGITNRQCVLRFGLPTTPAESTEQTRQVLRRVWLRNGVRYTETVFVWRSNESAKGGEAALLVNIEGDNISADYAEAWAEFTLDVGRRRQELELKDGLIWRRTPDGRFVVGMLEVPDAGVVRRSGEVLQFRGSIPPSLKGRMTLKVPLTTSANSAAACAWLEDIDVDREVRKLTTSPPHANELNAVILAEEITAQTPR
jgi:hypothetical protein